MEFRLIDSDFADEKGDDMNKPLKTKYMVLNKEAKKAEVKAKNTDIGGTFYVYDLFDASGNIIALNRYVYKNKEEQPFEQLTEGEELILNPPVEEVVPEEIEHGK